jgi:hypothetical protein
VYDSAITGKQAMTQRNASQGDRHVGNKTAGQNYPAGKGARSAGGGQNNNLPRYLICLKRIYNFLCSMLVYTPFVLCFVTLRGVFMHFPELTY